MTSGRVGNVNNAQETNVGQIGSNRKKYYRLLFFISAAINGLAGVSYILAFEHVSESLGVESVPTTPLLAMYAGLFGLAVLLFGMAYFVAGCRPEAEHSFWLILLGAIGKCSVFSLMLYYVVVNDVTWQHAGATFVFDALFACLFVEYLIWHRRVMTTH